jgi:hypothetical protein
MSSFAVEWNVGGAGCAAMPANLMVYAKFVNELLL